jgi:hypothetical protein
MSLMCQSWWSSHTSIWPASVLWQYLWMQSKCDSTISSNTSNNYECIPCPLQTDKLILGSKEAEETNLLEFIRKVGLEGGEVGGGGWGKHTWWWPVDEAQQLGDGKPGKPLGVLPGLISESGFKTRSTAATRTKLSLESTSRTRTKLSVGSRSRSKRPELLKKQTQYGQVHHNQNQASIRTYTNTTLRSQSHVKIKDPQNPG